jgi:YidC/Oxa1 family membrane protein insertase
MLHTFWITFIHTPLHNILAILLGTVSFGDLGIAIILLTVLVKLVLLPLAKKSIISQLKMKKLEPKLKEIKTLYPDKAIQAQKTMEVYKTEGVNPFSGFLLVLIQLPILIALFSLFRNGVSFAPESLYSFVHAPENISMKFLGLIDLAKPSIVLAVFVGITQYYLAILTIGKNTKQAVAVTENTKPSFQDEMAKSMNMQMRYVMPVMMAFFAYVGTGIVALYFLTSNIMTYIQEYIIRKKHKQELGITE